MTLLSLNATRWLTTDLLWSNVAYYRDSGKKTINGDVNEVSDPRNGVTPFEDGDPNASSTNRTTTDQRGYGFSTQLALTTERTPGERNLLVAGGGFDHSDSAFGQTYQLGGFGADRSAAPTGAETEIVNLKGDSGTASVYLLDTYSPGPEWHVTASARYNRTAIRTSDRLAPPLPPPAQGLDNDLVYTKLNPALGVSFTPRPSLSAYAGFSQGNRPPSPIELGCSDPASPCNLPNAMASDPPLKQVVSRTFETGVRGKTEAGLKWAATAFRTTSRDDILFVSSSASSGFFENFGQTRRQGLEASMERFKGRLGWALNYGLVDATYQSSALIFSQANSTADANGNIQVSPGDRIPGIPLQHLNALVRYDFTDKVAVAANAVAVSRQFARGNDNNQHQADGVAFLGSGEIAGYTVLNLNASYKLEKGFQLFAKVSNVFDRRYASAGALRQNFFPSGTLTAPGGQTNETFYAPGTPRGVWVGLEYAG
jgi:outer membrane receptor protein involved in Fe transport